MKTNKNEPVGPFRYLKWETDRNKRDCADQHPLFKKERIVFVETPDKLGNRVNKKTPQFYLFPGRDYEALAEWISKQPDPHFHARFEEFGKPARLVLDIEIPKSSCTAFKNGSELVTNAMDWLEKTLNIEELFYSVLFSATRNDKYSYRILTYNHFETGKQQVSQHT